CSSGSFSFAQCGLKQKFNVAAQVIDTLRGDVCAVLGLGQYERPLQHGLSVQRQALCSPFGANVTTLHGLGQENTRGSAPHPTKGKPLGSLLLKFGGLGPQAPQGPIGGQGRSPCPGFSVPFARGILTPEPNKLGVPVRKGMIPGAGVHFDASATRPTPNLSRLRRFRSPLAGTRFQISASGTERRWAGPTSLAKRTPQ
ncbi:MAG: hypothetical protein ACRETD_13235, partial [Steroidobacteraceae bacterium]